MCFIHMFPWNVGSWVSRTVRSFQTMSPPQVMSLEDCLVKCQSFLIWGKPNGERTDFKSNGKQTEFTFTRLKEETIWVLGISKILKNTDYLHLLKYHHTRRYVQGPLRVGDLGGCSCYSPLIVFFSLGYNNFLSFCQLSYPKNSG